MGSERPIPIPELIRRSGMNKHTHLQARGSKWTEHNVAGSKLIRKFWEARHGKNE